MITIEIDAFPFDSHDKIQTNLLDTFDYEGTEQLIKLESKELTAICPFNTLPDYGKLTIEYYPDGGKCINGFSLKRYMVSFRNIGIYQEDLTAKIYKDLKALLKTRRLKVTTIYEGHSGFNTMSIEGHC